MMGMTRIGHFFALFFSMTVIGIFMVWLFIKDQVPPLSNIMDKEFSRIGFIKSNPAIARTMAASRDHSTDIVFQ